MSKQILILGGGYGGLLTALTARQYLSPEEATITVVNRYPTHQIITELHRLAAGSIAEQAVALPLEKLLRGKNDAMESKLPSTGVLQLMMLASNCINFIRQ